jgi:hypothetical protein
MAVVGAGVAAASLGIGAVAGVVSGGAAVAGAGSAASAGNSSSGVASSVAGVSSGGSTGGAAGGAVPPPTSSPRGPISNDGGPRRQPDPPVSSGSGGASLDSTFASATHADVEAPTSYNASTGNDGARRQNSPSAVLAGVGGEPLAGSGFEGQTTAGGFRPSVLGINSANWTESTGADAPTSSIDGEPNSGSNAGPVNTVAPASEISSVGSMGSSMSAPPASGRGDGIRSAAQKAGNSLRNASRRLDSMRHRLSRVRPLSDAAPHQSPPRMPVEHED